MNYQSYTVNDFIQDDAFLRWVLSPEEATERYWQQVIEQFPSQQRTIQQARQLVYQLAAAEEKPVSEQQLAALWTRIDDETRSVRPLRTNWQRWRTTAVAASIALICLIGFLAVSYQEKQNLSGSITGAKTEAKSDPNVWSTVKNTSSHPVWITLPDSSRVSLLPQSRIDYTMRSGATRRQVKLLGGAFFEVTRNPARPFLVYADNTVTKVLGTSFWIRANQRDQKVEVTVRTGKVSIYTQANEPLSRQSLTLTPNQVAIFQPKNGHLYKELVRAPQPVPGPTTAAQLVYTDAPVSRILRQLEQVYGIPILFDEKSLSDQCILTADLTHESYLDAITKVCKSQGLAFEIVDGQIVITGHCSN